MFEREIEVANGFLSSRSFSAQTGKSQATRLRAALFGELLASDGGHAALRFGNALQRMSGRSGAQG